MEIIESGESVNLIEFAKMVGVSPSAISRAIAIGRLNDSVTRYPNRTLKINVKRGIEEFAAKRQRSARNKGDTPEVVTSDISDLEKKLKHYQAELARLKFEEQEGSLVSSDKVKKTAFKIARSVRDAMINIPDRLAAELSGMTDQFLIHKRISEEIREALENLTNEVSFDDEESEADE